jgi:aminoglycoside phosphotransferase (APT) family kinase protein
MSVSNYLWAVAKGLQTKVLPDTTSNVARDALNNSIGILSVLANALEPGSPAPIQPPAAAPSTPADTDRLPGPAENAAAYRDTGTALAGACAQLAASAARNGALDAGLRESIRWEKQLLDAAITRMDAVLALPPASAADPRLQIDTGYLQQYLSRQLSAPTLTIEDFRQVLGGRSRQTGLFRIAGVAGHPANLVVQRDIPGMTPGPAFASVAAQFAVLTRLRAAGLKVPAPVCCERDPQFLGSAFLVVERCSGRVVEPDYWAHVNRPSVALETARQMGLLHAQPIGDLATMIPHSRQRSDREGWRAELDKLAAEWRRLAHWPSVTVSAAIAWMQANIDCVEDLRALVHNDMVFHNILAEGDELTAILDWEQISVGHPAEDLGYCYPVVSASIDWQQFMAAYAAAGGPRIDQRQVDFFALRAILRLMILVLIGGRETFEKGLSEDVLVANAGASFSQRLLHRFAQVLDSVLSRS